MSWKSLVTAGLLCVLASPVFAAPTLGIVSTAGTAANGHLDSSGNWVWTVQVTPDFTATPDTTGTPVAIELGFTSTSTGVGTAANTFNQGDVISAVRTVPANFVDINPGTVVFSSWQTAGNGLLDANSNNRPTGIQTQCNPGNCSTESYTTPAALGNDSSVQSNGAQQVFAALGSVNFAHNSGAQNAVTIKVQRPSVTSGNVNTSTTIQVSGAYGGNGRISQVTGLSGSNYTTSNFDTYGGASYSFTMNARGGDTDLDGLIQVADYSALIGNFGQSGKTWQDGDFDGDGVVQVSDYSMLIGTFNQSYTVGPTTPGAGSGGGGLQSGNVPEPASIALLGLAVLGGLGINRRRR